MSRTLLLQAHAAGALLLGLGLLHGTWAWHRVRMLERAGQDRAAVLQRLRQVYLLFAVPGSLLLLGSGSLLIAQHHSLAWAWTQPWLLAMLGVTLLEFTEGITVTRTHLARALTGQHSRDDLAPHLDLPLFLAVLVLGLWRPLTWWPVLGVVTGALAVTLAMWLAARRGRF